MTGQAIAMMIVSIVIIWGGLLASILYLRARPEVTDGPGAIDPDDDTTADHLTRDT